MYLIERGLLHNPDELLLAHFAVAVAIGLVNHLLKLLVRHVLTQLLCNALQILEGDLACKLLIALNMIV